MCVATYIIMWDTYKVAIHAGKCIGVRSVSMCKCNTCGMHADGNSHFSTAQGDSTESTQIMQTTHTATNKDCLK